MSETHARATLAYFDVTPIVKLIPTPTPVTIATHVSSSARHGRTPSITSFPPSSFASSTSFSSASAASSASTSAHIGLSTSSSIVTAVSSSAQHSRQNSSAAAAGGVSTPYAVHHSRHGLSRLSCARVVHTKLNERILPLTPYSPRCILPGAVGLERMKEEQLVQRLMEILNLPLKTTKVLEPHAPLFSEHEAPPIPPTAANEQHREFVTYLRRTVAVAEAEQKSEWNFATLNSMQKENMEKEGPFDWLRLTLPLDQAFSAEDLADTTRWRSPFVSEARFTASEDEDAHSLKSLYDSWHTLDSAAAPEIVNLSTLDLSANALMTCFRFGVRSSLLTSKRERQFHEQVILLAQVCGLDTYTIYPFLKVWTSSIRARKFARKSELKRQLDWLDKHSYYSLAAFADRATWMKWLKLNAMAIHRQLIKLSQQIDDLRHLEKSKRSSLKKLPGCLSTCMGLDSDNSEDDRADIFASSSTLSSSSSTHHFAYAPAPPVASLHSDWPTSPHVYAMHDKTLATAFPNALRDTAPA